MKGPTDIVHMQALMQIKTYHASQEIRKKQQMVRIIPALLNSSATEVLSGSDLLFSAIHNNARSNIIVGVGI